MEASHLPHDPGENLSRLPPQATLSSRIRYEAAQALVDAAPAAFGQEAILSGSAARGVSDEDSDIEIVFYVETFPSRPVCHVWLQRIGASDIVFETESSKEDQRWVSFVFREIWVEAGWQLLAAHEQRIDALARGAVIAHGPLTLAWIMHHAVSLRSVGLLHRWQQQLASYSEALAQKILADATRYWYFPHLLAVRWALIRRGEHLALLERLYQDTRNMLRILFAINHQWEPDWKWLYEELHRLTIKPERLLERIDAIFLEPDQERRVALCMGLIYEVLALVPEQYDVTRVRANIEETIQAHGLGNSGDDFSQSPPAMSS
jgi:hypothetical protein